MTWSRPNIALGDAAEAESTDPDRVERHADGLVATRLPGRAGAGVSA
jgi:hypothetical protein